jgi:hypothetical protein
MIYLCKRSRITFVEGHSREVTKSEALHPRKRGSFGTVANVKWDPMRSIMFLNVWNAIILDVRIAMSSQQGLDNIFLSDKISEGKSLQRVHSCLLTADLIGSLLSNVLRPILQYTFPLMFSISVHFKATISTMHLLFQTFPFVPFLFLFIGQFFIV